MNVWFVQGIKKTLHLFVQEEGKGLRKRRWREMAFWAVLFDESCKKVLYMWVINSGVRAVTYQW